MYLFIYSLSIECDISQIFNMHLYVKYKLDIYLYSITKLKLFILQFIDIHFFLIKV